MTKAVALARYKESDVYNRDDPMFDDLAPAVGLSAAKIDESWMKIALADRAG